MRQHVARILLTVLCMATIQALALESPDHQTMARVCGLTAGRQQLYVLPQLQGKVPADQAGLARYRELLGVSSSSARDSIRIARAGDPALLALNDQSFNDAAHLGVVLQSEPSMAAPIAARVFQQEQGGARSGPEQLAALQEAWTDVCLRQLTMGTTLSRKRELLLCNTIAVLGVMLRQRNEPRFGPMRAEQVQVSFNEADVDSMINDTLALSWVDGEMLRMASGRAALIAAEAPASDVKGFRELAQQLARDPMRLPYGSQCEAMINGTREGPANQKAAALVEVSPRFEVTFRPYVNDFYPTGAIRPAERVAANVRICFNSRGAVTDTAVVESSGSSAFDDAAMKYAMQLRFKPGLLNFEPHGQCVMQRVNF